MSQVNSLLAERLKKKTKVPSKTAALAKRSAAGDLTSFAGVFGISELSENEKDLLQQILEEYTDGRTEIEEDLEELISLTSEVKAINNQAALLHGERIQKAQTILKQYKDGAFTSWLLAVYGNRQTPYNFLQYFEFYTALPKPLRPQLEEMPRQAVYTLASREGEISKKHKIVKLYSGQTKNELLKIIRDTFPLADQDKRKRKQGDLAVELLKKVHSLLTEKKAKITHRQKSTILYLISELETLVAD
jgi:hypothetical protein